LKKIYYITSTLRRAGPTNQIHNLIKYLDKEIFEPHLITLSPEPQDTLFDEFLKLDLQIQSLNLSRFDGLFKAKQKLEQTIKIINPDLIHSQGIRPDHYMSKINPHIPWLLTARNYPFVDYPMKFGKLRGIAMAFQHIKSMRKCKNVITCSYSISQLLSKHKIVSTSIQNGVDFKSTQKSGLLSALQKPIFITVGSLISRKNVRFIIDAFNIYLKVNKGSLVVLGDGPQLQELKNAATKYTYFYGNVHNVADYLIEADYFISASLSEGLPNTVLEALTSGLPVLLSDIPSHSEIAQEYKDGCKIYLLKDGPTSLAQQLKNIASLFPKSDKNKISESTQKIFSAQAMSEKYQRIYLDKIEIR
jgi:glycosyltransferase involved in cell wall biosynthesis